MWRRRVEWKRVKRGMGTTSGMMSDLKKINMMWLTSCFPSDSHAHVRLPRYDRIFSLMSTTSSSSSVFTTPSSLAMWPRNEILCNIITEVRTFIQRQKAGLIPVCSAEPRSQNEMTRQLNQPTGSEAFLFGWLRIASSSSEALQEAPGGFVVECEAAGMRISSSKFQSEKGGLGLSPCFEWKGLSILG